MIRVGDKTPPMYLDQTALPLRDYHKAKRLLWNPQDLDFGQDRRDWAAMSAREQTLIRATLAQFLGGEEAVTHDLSPLMIALRREGGHLEEEMFITTQLFEEAKHVEFFAAVIDEVGIPHPERGGSAMGGRYGDLFVELEKSLDALLTTPTHAAQIEAVATYHIIVEGVLAETGYYGIFTALRAKGLMPGLTDGLEMVQRDEARHIAFGLHLLSRLLRAEPDLWACLEARLNHLLPLAQGILLDSLSPYLPDVPFGVDLNDVLSYAGRQYMARLNVLERARAGQIG